MSNDIYSLNFDSLQLELTRIRVPCSVVMTDPPFILLRRLFANSAFLACCLWQSWYAWSANAPASSSSSASRPVVLLRLLVPIQPLSLVISDWACVHHEVTKANHPRPRVLAILLLQLTATSQSSTPTLQQSESWEKTHERQMYISPPPA